LKLRIMDATQETLIVPDVLRIDTEREPINVIAKNLNDIANNGIWLTPYRGLPQVNGIPDLDIVYMDPHFRVIRCLEGFRQGSMPLPDISASSALILPSGRSSAARIQIGDRLDVRDVATGSPWGGYREALDQGSSLKDAESANGHVEPPPKPPMKGLRSILAWLIGQSEKRKFSDRRRAERRPIPGLVAYFSLPSLPKGFEVKTISTEGFYVFTEERWPPGTSIMVSLQIINPLSQQVEAMISVQSKVIWLGSDGVGFAFDDDPVHRNHHATVTGVEELQQLNKFLQMIRS
jgi:hypothetical protein